jgi:hypothetical protein
MASWRLSIRDHPNRRVCPYQEISFRSKHGKIAGLPKKEYSPRHEQEPVPEVHKSRIYRYFPPSEELRLKRCNELNPRHDLAQQPLVVGEKKVGAGLRSTSQVD